MGAPTRRADLRKSLSRLVQTHVTEEAGKLLDQRVTNSGLSEAAYLRVLILRDVGLAKGGH